MGAGPKLALIWAKSAPSGARGETLVEHTTRVVAAFAQLARRYPNLPALVRQPQLWHRAFWACWFHDLGKIAAGFQAMLHSGAAPWHHRHEVLSLIFLHSFCAPEEEDFPWMAAGIASHHKDAPVILEEKYNVRLQPTDWGAEQLAEEVDEETWREALAWTSEAVPEELSGLRLQGLGIRALAPRPAAETCRAAVPLLIADSLRSYWGLWMKLKKLPATDPRNQAAVALRGLVMQADHLGSAHSPGLDLASLPTRGETLSCLRLREEDLFPHQRSAAGHIGSIVFSAPTGSGKTEAALLWALRQQEEAAAPRTVTFILPYHASLNAMRGRLADLLHRDVALIHAKSLHTLYRLLLDRGYAQAEAEKLAREHNNLARLNKPAIRVTTPYQLLKAAYRMRGYEAVWTSLASSLIVLDEPHAYEPARLGLLLELLAELVARWNANVCAMTATMPAWLRRSLTGALRAAEIPTDKSLFQRFARHRIEIVSGNIQSPAALALAAEEHRSGRSVLLAVNTVRTAQEVYGALRASLPPDALLLIHSRFTAQDRLEKESAVTRCLAVGRSRPRPLVAVSTQVIEVSLNLDFDSILTEPAPLEALVQRFGRVNRQRREPLAPVRVLTESLHDERVYDRELTERGLAALRRNDGAILDEQKVTDWLDEVYRETARQKLEEVERGRQEFRAACLESLRAFESDDQLEDAFDSLFDGTEVVPESKAAEYESLARESSLRAAELLTPVPRSLFHRFRDRFVWNPSLKVRIARFPYDREYGLRLG